MEFSKYKKLAPIAYKIVAFSKGTLRMDVSCQHGRVF